MTSLTIDDTTTAVAPSITSITSSPGVVITSGAIGATITINGEGFSGATVKFYRNVAAVISSNSGTAIVVTIPPSARTGPIIVTTPTGMASTGAFTIL